MFIKSVAASIASGNGNTYGRVYNNYLLYSPPCSGPMLFLAHNFDGAWARGSDYKVDPLLVEIKHPNITGAITPKMDGWCVFVYPRRQQFLHPRGMIGGAHFLL